MKRTLHRIQICFIATLLAACSKSDPSGGQQSITGIGGSLARFAVINDRLFTVSDHAITSYDISNANAPVKQTSAMLGFGVETIFPRGTTLFIGTQTGMKILDASNPTASPVLLSDFTHIRSCDPVVANSGFAFVTLRTGNTCTRGVNELQVIDIADPTRPKMVKLYNMKNPKGLALDGNNLFVCDEGIKYYDASNPGNLTLKTTENANAEDLIAHNGILMAIGPDGLIQYSYETGSLIFLSRIPTL